MRPLNAKFISIGRLPVPFQSGKSYGNFETNSSASANDGYITSSITGGSCLEKEDDVKNHSASLQQHLQAGDKVRVKSKEEILSLLDPWLEQKGCGFMEEMWIHCGTEQVVRKRVEKFLDEATLRMRTSQGIVILEGLMCEGTMDFGRCDRSCFYFWREEWLEKIG